jgi:hypothetical protein
VGRRLIAASAHGQQLAHNRTTNAETNTQRRDQVPAPGRKQYPIDGLDRAYSGGECRNVRQLSKYQETKTGPLRERRVSSHDPGCVKTPIGR